MVKRDKKEEDDDGTRRRGEKIYRGIRGQQLMNGLVCMHGRQVNDASSHYNTRIITISFLVLFLIHCSIGSNLVTCPERETQLLSLP